MKKFLSMVLAAAMVISTVPATAFALDAKATAKVVDSRNLTEADADKVEEGAKPPTGLVRLQQHLNSKHPNCS